jgi:hypothetical protein
MRPLRTPVGDIDFLGNTVTIDSQLTRGSSADPTGLCIPTDVANAAVPDSGSGTGTMSGGYTESSARMRRKSETGCDGRVAPVVA